MYRWWYPEDPESARERGLELKEAARKIKDMEKESNELRKARDRQKTRLDQLEKRLSEASHRKESHISIVDTTKIGKVEAQAKVAELKFSKKKLKESFVKLENLQTTISQCEAQLQDRGCAPGDLVRREEVLGWLRTLC